MTGASLCQGLYRFSVEVCLVVLGVMASKFGVMEMQNEVRSSSAARRPRLLDQIRDKCRLLHYSIRTESAYVDWVEKFLRFHRLPDGTWRHPRELTGPEIARFLTYLAVERRVAASTQSQAMSAIVFLYRQVLELDP